MKEFVEMHPNRKMEEHLEPYGLPTVFISYNWSNSAFVDEIEASLVGKAKVRRDRGSIKPWGSISDFMKSIRQQDFAILVISDDYLKSSACLYEVVQLMKDDGWNEKTMYVVFDDARTIYDALGQAEYIKFWDEKYKGLEQKIRELPLAATTKLTEELNKSNTILLNIGGFMSKVADAHNPPLDKVIAEIKNRVIQAATANQQKVQLGDQYCDGARIDKLELEAVAKQYYQTTQALPRAEFAKKLVLLMEMNLRNVNADLHIVDVPESHWAYKYINLVLTSGLMSTFTDGEFKPEKEITYAEMAACLVLALGYGKDLTGTYPNNVIVRASQLGLYYNVAVSDFNDYITIDDAQIIFNNASRLMFTRAELAECLVKLLRMNTKEPVPDLSIVDVPESHWAYKYICLAYSAELMKVYVDGEFKPDRKVTYTELSASLVFALGYGKDLTGTYPNNVIVNAAQKGLFSGVFVLDFSYFVTRDKAQQIIDNANAIANT